MPKALDRPPHAVGSCDTKRGESIPPDWRLHLCVSQALEGATILSATKLETADKACSVRDSNHQQLHQLASEAGRHKTMILVMGYTGLRWGEIIGLRVRDTDLIRNRLTVSQNAVEVGAQIHIGTPKTHERRAVPFPAFLADSIAQQTRDKLPDALLFPGPGGHHMRRTRTDGEGEVGSRTQYADLACRG